MAQQSFVLLRNEGNLLPLSTMLKKIAVIGPNADSVRNLFGDYAYPAHMESLTEMTRVSNTFNMPIPEGVTTVEDFIEARTVLGALREAADPACEIRYARGCGVADTSIDGFAEAVAAARGADVAVVVVGDKGGLTNDCTSGESRDRAVLNLPGVQEQLVRAIYETGTPIVLILMNGRPVMLNWMAESIPAILECWFPGEEGGSAICDVLFGEVTPGGKLPISFPRHVGQVPTFYSHTPSGGRSFWKIDYVDTPVSPLYPFGFGLSYTTFSLSNLQVSDSALPNGTVTVRVDVRNTGERSGDEVVQIYTHQRVRGITRPLKELKAFQRVGLEPGQTRSITFNIPVNLLSFINADDQRVVAPGKVEIMVGTSSANLPLCGSVILEGDVTPVERAYSASAQVGPPF